MGSASVEHQLVGLQADSELPAQHFKAEAALAQGGPEGSLRVHLRQGAGRLLELLLNRLQDLRWDASVGSHITTCIACRSATVVPLSDFGLA